MVRYFFKLLLISTFIILGITFTNAQSDNYNWIFLKEAQNISISYRESDSLHYEELKFATSYTCQPKHILAVIKDIDNMHKWSYLCEETQMINRVSSTEWYYYYITKTPWPLTNRDAVLHINVFQYNEPNKLVIACENVDGLIDVRDDYVRVPRLRSRWELTQANDSITNLEFYFSSDPGGVIPTWLLNSAVSYGPIQTLTTLKGFVEAN